MECFAFVWFCMFCLANIWQKVLEHFSHSSSLLILAQIFAPFDCLHSSWCNLSWKFSVIVSFFLFSQSFSISIQVHSRGKGWSMSFFSTGFCIFQRVTCRGMVIFHTFKLKKQLFAYEEKTCLSEQKFVKYHETANFCVFREFYQ